MPIKKTVVLIPYWIHDVFKRNQIPLADCLVYSKIKPLVSASDLMAFVKAQKYLETITGVKEYYSSALWGEWFDSAIDGSVQVHSSASGSTCEMIRQDIGMIVDMSCDDSVDHDVRGRLFDTTLKTDTKKEPFIVVDLTPKFIGVIVNPGHFPADKNCSLQLPLIEAILKVMYSYDAFHVVAETVFFKRFIELLDQVSV